MAVEKRRAFAGQPYWGRPVPGWGDEQAWLLVVGLAPAAHGGNRTGRIFTGDRSGDWLFAALHRAGLATRRDSVDAADGQRLVGARMAAPVRCAPPANKPTPRERDACAPWFDREVTLLEPSLRVVLALGAFAWEAMLSAAARLGWTPAAPAAGATAPRRPRFAHGASVGLHRPSGPSLTLLATYHVSQQNTFTGKLTERMLDDVLAEAYAAAGVPGVGAID